MQRIPGRDRRAESAHAALGRGLSYSVIVAEYLLAAGLFVPTMWAAILALPTHQMIDTSIGFALLALLGGSIALVLGLPVSLVILGRRTRATDQQPRTGPAAVVVASKAAVTGLLWGLLGAVPLTGVFIAVINSLSMP